MVSHNTQCGAQDLSARLFIDPVRCLDGKVVDTTPTAVVVDFPQCSGLIVPDAEGVHIAFDGPALEDPLLTRAKVLPRSADEGHDRYEFQVGEVQGNALMAIFNRRGACRVQPDENDPVRVTLRGQGAQGSVEMDMKDISETGLSILVDARDEQGLCEHWTFDLAFTLPGIVGSMEMIGHVRHRTLLGSHVQYGFEFDGLETANFELQQERIRGYVKLRQAQMVRQAKNAYGSEPE